MIGRRTNRYWLAFVAVAALIAGCGDSGSAKTPTAAQLEQALLTPADAGAGWTELARQSPEPPTLPTSSEPVEVPAGCDVPSETVALFHTTLSDYNAFLAVIGAPGTTVDRPLAVIEKVWPSSDAKKLFAQARVFYDGCLGKTWTTSDGEQITFATISGLDELGDESLSLLQRASEPTGSGNVEWYTPTVFARFGNVLVLLQGLDIHDAGTAPRLDAAQLNPIFKAAAAKLSKLS